MKIFITILHLMLAINSLMVSQNHRKISTLDLIGNGKFTLFCWLQGDKWKLAVDNINRQLNLDIKVIQVGPKRDVEDSYGELSRCWTNDENECMLIRPDGYIAWTSNEIERQKMNYIVLYHPYLV